MAPTDGLSETDQVSEAETEGMLSHPDPAPGSNLPDLARGMAAADPRDSDPITADPERVDPDAAAGSGPQNPLLS